MTWATVLVANSMRTSLGPPGTTLSMPGDAGSSTQRLPRLSQTTDCTHTKCSRGDGVVAPALRQAFHVSSGYGFNEPSRATSATETGQSSVQRGKLTNMRPSADTA